MLPQITITPELSAILREMDSVRYASPSAMANLLTRLEAEGKLFSFDKVMGELGLTEADLEQEGT